MSMFKKTFNGYSSMALVAAGVGGAAVGAVLTAAVTVKAEPRTSKEASDLGFQYNKLAVLFGRSEERAALANEVSPEEISNVSNGAIARAKVRKAKALAAELA